MTHSGSMFITNQSPPKRALHGIVHPHARLERAEGPEPYVLGRRCHARGQRERAHRADDRAQLRMQRQGGVCLAVGGTSIHVSVGVIVGMRGRPRDCASVVCHNCGV